MRDEHAIVGVTRNDVRTDLGVGENPAHSRFGGEDDHGPQAAVQDSYCVRLVPPVSTEDGPASSSTLVLSAHDVQRASGRTSTEYGGDGRLDRAGVQCHLAAGDVLACWSDVGAA